MNRSERTWWLARGLMYLCFVVLAYFALRRLAFVLAPVGTGLFLAYVLNPVVTRIERRGVPRPAAVALLLLGLGAIAAVVLLFVPPLLESELKSFATSWHQYQARLDKSVLPWLRQKLHLPGGSSLADIFVGGFARLGSLVEGSSGDIAGTALRAIDTATVFLRVLVAVVLTPVFAIYFLLDYPALADGIRALVPPRHREQVMSLVSEINHALASWLRGQLLAMLVLAAAYSVGLALAGIPLGVAIGLCTGLLAFVPYVGVAVGFCLAVAVALLDWHGAAPLIGVVLTFAVVQSCDTLLVTPRIVGKRIGLSPVAVIFALTLGGNLLGYAGLLLAVPLAAVCKVLIAHARSAYLASDFYHRPVTEAAVEKVDDREPPQIIQGGRP